MNRNEHDRLISELAGLNELMAITPESAVIDRLTLEYRKSQIEEELNTNPPPPKWPASAVLTFGGKPVIDFQGISADFGSEAMKAFGEVIVSLADGSGNGQGERGGTQRRDAYPLMITGVARGSFGFQIEEVFDQQTTFLSDSSPVEVAIGQARGILGALVGADEEALAEAIFDADEKGISNIRNFLKLLADNEAVCSLSFKEDTFRFRDVGQVQRGLTHLGQENISENEIEVEGHFQGFLPNVRRAEFVRSDTGEVISGRVDRLVTDAESINNILNKSVNLRIRTRQVGNSRPRYTIVGYNLALEDN